LGIVDGLDGTERGYQGRCLDEVDGRVNVQSKNVGNASRNTGIIAGNSRNAGYGQQASENNATMQRVLRTSANSRNTQNVQRYNCSKKGQYIKSSKELEELNATCITMARIQMVNNDANVGPSYDSKFENEAIQLCLTGAQSR
ncbi:hypothetical protein Tco_1397690, partial [Tanacetum coccineum]